jgi:quercetin dioxygenase-like cupin family protein
MSNYTVVSVENIENAFEARGWPGAMRFLTKDLGNEQVAITHRTMPQHAGGKGGYGHKHKTQEEIVYVIRGELEIKLDDKIEIVKAGQAIRIAPEVVRSLWNEKPEEAEILIISTKAINVDDDTEIVKDFWPV